MILTVCPRCASEQEAHPKFEPCHACGYFGVMFLREKEEALSADSAQKGPNHEFSSAQGRGV